MRAHGVKKRVWLTGVIASGIFFIILSPSLFAQQPAGQAIPETRNPQSGTAQPFQQQTGVQTTEPQDLLNRNQPIQIPAGRPVRPDSNNTSDNGLGNLVWMAILLGLGSLGLIMYWRRGNKIKLAQPEPAAQVPVVTYSEPKKKLAKNKTKAKSRTKRRKRK